MDSKQKLQSLVRHEIAYLLSHTDHPKIHEDIDLIWVFSGPGTFDEALKPEDDTYLAWMDRYRILYAATIARKITAKRLKKHVSEITKDDIRSFGPKILYNGTPDENRSLGKAIADETLYIPKENCIILDYYVTDTGTIKPFFNTKDQVQSITPPLLEHLLPLRRVALVSHASHFPRILRYLQKYHTFPREVTIEVFALSLPKNAQEDILDEETNKTWEYFLKGDLPWQPLHVELS